MEPRAGSDRVAGEADLIAQAQSGHLEAFDALVRRHQDVVFAVAMRMLGRHDEAQDIAQDTFVRAFQALRTFRGEAKLSTWLIAITMNLCRNRRRWWARRRRVIAGSLDEPGLLTGEPLAQQVADPRPGPAQRAQAHEWQQSVLQALQGLDEPARSVVILRDVQGYSYEEIAQMVRCRVGTVKSRLNRARLKLRALLDGVL